MARSRNSSDDEPRTQDSDSAERTQTSASTSARTSDTDQPEADEGMRHETHGELPSERPPSGF